MGFDIEQVATSIIAERSRRRMSQDVLAEKSGIPLSTLRSYETGSSVMSLKNAWALADVFEMQIDELFHREIPPAETCGEGTPASTH